MDQNDKRALWVGWTWEGEESAFEEGESTRIWAGHWHTKEEGPCKGMDDCTVQHTYCPDYDTSLDACLELIEKVKEIGWLCTLSETPNGWIACFGKVGADIGSQIEMGEIVDAPAQAICDAIDKLIDHLEDA